MHKSKVLLALSGGMDSAVAAILLKNHYEVTGITFRLLHQSRDDRLTEKNHYLHETGSALAEKLKIKHYLIDLHEEFFQEVIHYFYTEYLAGHTPSPCVICNEKIKWHYLMLEAVKKKCSYIATGHYAGKILVGNKYYIKRAKDVSKDQSYYLWKLNQDILKKALFPLYGYCKDEIKEIAYNHGLDDLSRKRESMGVCFLKGKDYGSLLKQYYPERIQKIGKGKVIDANNRVIGYHDGYPFYTSAQKKGLYMEGASDNLAVERTDPETNTVFVKFQELLKYKTLYVKDVVLIDPNEIKKQNIEVKIRGVGINPSGFCKIEPTGRFQFRITLEDAAWAPSPGQPVVFYRGDVLIGGGILEDFK